MPNGMMGGAMMGGTLAVALTAKDQASRVFNQVGMSSTAMAGTIGMAMTRINWAMVGAGAAIALFTAIGIKKAIEFEMETTKAMMMFGKITEETFTEAQQRARAMAKEYGLSANETVKALYYLGSAGLTTAQAFEAFDAVIRFSRVGLIDTALAAETAMTAMKVFGYEAEDVAHVVDMMMEAVRNAQMTTQQLADAFSYIAPVAKSAGMTLAETSALIGKLADAGIRGSMAGTSLRRSIINLIAPTGRTAEALDRLGVSVYDASGSQRDMLTVLSDVFKALQSASDETAALAAQHIFGARAIAGMLSLVDVGVEVIREYAVAVEAATATQEMWADMSQTASVQVGRMTESFMDFARQLGKQVLPILKIVASGLSTVMGFLASIPPPLDKVIYGFIALAGPLLIIGGLLPILKAGFVMVAGSTGLLGASLLKLAIIIKANLALIGAVVAILVLVGSAYVGWTREMKVANAGLTILNESALKAVGLNEALNLGATESASLWEKIGMGFKEMITLGRADTERTRLAIDAEDALNALLKRHSWEISNLFDVTMEYVKLQVEGGKANEFLSWTILKLIKQGKSQAEIMGYLWRITDGYFDSLKAQIAIDEIMLARTKELGREYAREGKTIQDLISIMNEMGVSAGAMVDSQAEYETTITDLLSAERKQALSTYETWQESLVSLVKPTEEQIVLARELNLAMWEESATLFELADTFSLTRAEIEANEMQLRAYSDQLWEVQDAMRGFSIQEQAARVEIAAIQRQARLEGRALAGAEIRQIDELQAGLEELRYQRDVENLQAMMLRDTEEDLRYENELYGRQVEEATGILEGQEWQLRETADVLKIMRDAGEVLSDWQRTNLLETFGLTGAWKDFANTMDDWVIPAIIRTYGEAATLAEVMKDVQKVWVESKMGRGPAPTYQAPTGPPQWRLIDAMTRGIVAPSLQQGGVVTKAGPFYLHPGEVYRKGEGGGDTYISISIEKVSSKADVDYLLDEVERRLYRQKQLGLVR